MRDELVICDTLETGLNMMMKKLQNGEAPVLDDVDTLLEQASKLQGEQVDGSLKYRLERIKRNWRLYANCCDKAQVEIKPVIASNFGPISNRMYNIAIGEPAFKEELPDEDADTKYKEVKDAVKNLLRRFEDSDPLKAPNEWLDILLNLEKSLSCFESCVFEAHMNEIEDRQGQWKFISEQYEKLQNADKYPFIKEQIAIISEMFENALKVDENVKPKISDEEIAEIEDGVKKIKADIEKSFYRDVVKPTCIMRDGKCAYELLGDIMFLEKDVRYVCFEEDDSGIFYDANRNRIKKYCAQNVKFDKDNFIVSWVMDSRLYGACVKEREKEKKCLLKTEHMPKICKMHDNLEAFEFVDNFKIYSDTFAFISVADKYLYSDKRERLRVVSDARFEGNRVFWEESLGYGSKKEEQRLIVMVETHIDQNVINLYHEKENDYIELKKKISDLLDSLKPEANEYERLNSIKSELEMAWKSLANDAGHVIVE